MNPENRRDGRVLIIHPPETKACEAPAGTARLAGSLRRHGVACRVWDANLEGQLSLMEARGIRSQACTDTWTRRAARHFGDNLAALRSRLVLKDIDRYRRTVNDLNHLLATSAVPYGVRLSLTDYEDERLSPFRSGNLLQAAAEPQNNPFHGWFSRRVSEILMEIPVSHIGFSLNYLSQALTTFAMIGFLRQAFPKIRIIMGGGLITSWTARRDWKNPFEGLADAFIAGAGEAPLLELFGREYDGRPDRPDFGDFELKDYLSPGVVLPYSGSSGCWWRRCTFCPERAEGNPYRPLPPSKSTADLRVLVAKTKPALIHLLDSAISPAFLEALTTEPPGPPWYGFVRVTPHLADLDFCLKLRASGCVMLKLGLESGDQGVLDALDKGTDLPTVSAALKNLKAAGIATYVYLLFGTPAETPEAARRTLDFTAGHAEEIGFLNLAIFNLPVCGPETQLSDTGEFYAGDLSLYRPFEHPRGWDRGKVRRFLEQEFKRQPAIRAIIRRDPPFFTSNHAAFFAVNRK